MTNAAAMETWLPAQAEKLVASWDGAMERYYPQYLATWTNPHSHHKALCNEWNTLDAVDYLTWDEILIGDNLKVVDLGAGTGWLSIYLSKRTRIAEIYAVDASRSNLDVMLPEMTRLMGGDGEKIRPIQAMFTPIMVDDQFFDAAVASSAVHHAPDLQEILQEVYRVLKPNGCFVILNEQPLAIWHYTAIALQRCLSIAKNMILRRWQPVARPVSASGVMLDPCLGDRGYCLFQWKQAIELAGFSFQAVTTPFYRYKGGHAFTDARLTHFIAKKNDHRS